MILKKAKSLLWANTKPKTPKAKKNGKKNAFVLQRSKYIPMHEIPNTNNLIQKERSFNLFLSRFHYTLSINKFQYNTRSCFL
ncbi:hypothetical protein ID0445_01310 [Helicobacter pylori]